MKFKKKKEWTSNGLVGSDYFKEMREPMGPLDYEYFDESGECIFKDKYIGYSG